MWLSHSIESDSNVRAAKQLRWAFIWSRLMGIPFWGMLSLFTMVLYREMHITPIQLTLILTLKPMTALLAPYWSQRTYLRPNLLLSNLVKANVFRYFPFLVAPWVNSPWILIAAFGLYMMFYRGVVPAWMEVIKLNLSSKETHRLIACGSALDYIATAGLPLLLGLVLDHYQGSWRILFSAAALIGLGSTWFLISLKEIISKLNKKEEETERGPEESTWIQKVLKPWNIAHNLMKNNDRFWRFQCGFMLGGSGLMLIQPALPTFFIDILHLSYTKMLIALALFKGIGFMMAMPAWVKVFRKWNVYYFSGWVTVLATAFPLFLLTSQVCGIFLYLAYVFYGAMQAGSELSWHMAGPLFSGKKDSTRFSSTNVLAVGIRGSIVPPMGAFLYAVTNSTVVIALASSLCIAACCYLFRCNFCFREREELTSEV